MIFRKTLRSNASSTSASCQKDVLMMCHCLIYKSELADHQIIGVKRVRVAAGRIRKGLCQTCCQHAADARTRLIQLKLVLQACRTWHHDRWRFFLLETHVSVILGLKGASFSTEAIFRTALLNSANTCNCRQICKDLPGNSSVNLLNVI